MSVVANQLISVADLDALAALANAKLLPAIPYSFNKFAGPDKIGLPPLIAPTATYGGTGSFVDGQKVTLRLYGYKTIAGTKYYSWEPLLREFLATAGAGTFSLKWNWTSITGPTAPDGYIVVIPRFFLLVFQYFWKDIGNVQTLTESGVFDASWFVDESRLSADFGGPAVNKDLPCGNATWLKSINTIHKDLFNKFDIFGGSSIAFGDAHKVSGPWCVSVSPICHLNIGGKPAYKNLKFVYSQSDSLTGNSLAPEADLLATFIGVNNGTNNFNFGVNGKLNGRITISSNPSGQLAANWTVSTTPSIGVTYTFNPHNEEGITALIFDLVNVPYTVGTPFVITVTPTAGGSVNNPGNPTGGGGKMDIVFTGEVSSMLTEDTVAIHTAGKAAISAELANTLPNISFTSPTGAVSNLESHWRAFCNGVFIAETLPTLGLMTFLDIDLPQYGPNENPGPFGIISGSSRREPIDGSLLPLAPAVANRSALWPVYRDTDFKLPAVNTTGSKAWQETIFTPFVTPLVTTNDIPAAGIGQNLWNYSIFVISGAADVKFLSSDPRTTLYVKAGAFPTVSDFDVSVPGGTLLSLAAALPGFAKDTRWFYSILNPTSGTISNTTTSIVIIGSPPNGTFFPTTKDDANNVIPLKEGYSYHFEDEINENQNPFPLFGYCVFQVNVQRQPIDNADGVGSSPVTGTAELTVKLGLMAGFGFSAEGIFQELQTITIPAGESGITIPVFWPVLAGAPLVYQCDVPMFIRALVNFQPMMHSTFLPATAKANGADLVIGAYNGVPWFNKDRCLLFFRGGFIFSPIQLPAAVAIYDDLENLLNVL